jgi:2-C-methyl-D-erythritol 4-phosphate cytidylyltransferase
MKLAVIIAAAGASRRFATPAAELQRSKLDEDLGGRPVLQRAVELFSGLAQTVQSIVAGPADEHAMAAFKERHADRLSLLGCTIVPGGRDHRYQTVQAALAHLRPEITHVAIHDAARPCTPADVIERVLAAAEHHPAVIPAIPVADTLKRIAPAPLEQTARDPLAAILGAAPSGPPQHRVEQTIDRSHLVAVQTPQVFEISLLRRAYAQTNLDSTDDAQLIERLGEPVITVLGDPKNLKLTRVEDLTLIRAIMGVRAPEAKPAHLRF